jgi:pimeloyl-ACP methyl ester carboxylesterase
MHLKTQRSQLFYTRQGNGKKALLLFHGFGQDHLAFREIIQTISPDYTCYAFDLYFHGSSYWYQDEQPLEKDAWKETMNQFLHENSHEEISLLGYSLGAKFVLTTLEVLPERVKEVFLVAPDGIKTSFWYSLATYPILFRRLFKSMISNPGRFAAITEVFRPLPFLDKGIIRFAENQMNTEEKRRRVYYSWVVLRHLKFDLRKIADILNEYQIRLMVIVGKYDKIIRKENMNALIQHVDRVELEEIEAGHNHLLGQATANLVKRSNR